MQAAFLNFPLFDTVGHERRCLLKRLLSFPPISFTLEAFSTYGRCGVAQAAAALSYFLILTLFPLLMCVNYFIGLFHLSLEQLLSGLDQVLPDQALAVMQDYLAYASLNQSPAIVAAALVAIALSASAGLRALLLAMDKLYGGTPRRAAPDRPQRDPLPAVPAHHLPVCGGHLHR